MDVSGALGDIVARQNHVIFGRRGCGKTLLLHSIQGKTDSEIADIYINCEDYRQHSFPNVLVEILDRVLAELESRLHGWFGRKKKSKALIREMRDELKALKEQADDQAEKVRETASLCPGCAPLPTPKNKKGARSYFG